MNILDLGTALDHMDILDLGNLLLAITLFVLSVAWLWLMLADRADLPATPHRVARRRASAGANTRRRPTRPHGRSA